MAGLVAVSLLLTFLHSYVSVVVGLYPPHGDHPPPHPPISTSQILDTKVLHNNWRRLIRRTVQLSSSSSVDSMNKTTTTSIIDFELVGQRLPDQAVLIFVWHRSKNKNRSTTCINNDRHDHDNHDRDDMDENANDGTVTLIREYMPSVDAYGYGLAAGMVDYDDNDDNYRLLNDKTLAAAQRELAEECLLERGEWYRLTPPPLPNSDDDDETPPEVVEGVVVDKYCTTKMVVYLVIDPVPIMDEHRRAAILADRDNDNAELGLQVVQVTLPQFRTECLPNMTIVANWASRLALDYIEGLLQRRP
jgi:8-oxo-dGTP pyrophosphatase MutT (NUDIX family)